MLSQKKGSGARKSSAGDTSGLIGKLGDLSSMIIEEEGNDEIL